MQTRGDIFGIWATDAAMAHDLKQLPDTVYRWRKRGRIPEEQWDAVIEAAARCGRHLTATDILAANTPAKQRGRPAHKIRKLKERRSEARAS